MDNQKESEPKAVDLGELTGVSELRGIIGKVESDALEKIHEGAIIVSRRVKDAVWHSVGSIQRPCDGCGEPVWASLSTQEMLRVEPKNPVFCLQCVTMIIKQEDS
jgi:hypothetical protein